MYIMYRWMGFGDVSLVYKYLFSGFIHIRNKGRLLLILDYWFSYLINSFVKCVGQIGLNEPVCYGREVFLLALGVKLRSL